MHTTQFKRVYIIVAFPLYHRRVQVQLVYCLTREAVYSLLRLGGHWQFNIQKRLILANICDIQEVNLRGSMCGCYDAKNMKQECS